MVITGDRQGPLVSVIIPTFNRARELADALESVAAQTYPNREVIVVDDGSTDNTAAVVDRAQMRCTYVHQKNSGLPAVARNAGIRRAAGAYIAFLDSDDLWLPEKLAIQVSALEADSEVGVSCTNALILREGITPFEKMYERNPLQGLRNALPVLLEGNQLATSTVVCRREILERVGGFCEDSRLRGVEDYDLWLRCSCVTRIEYLNEVLMLYRAGSSLSLSSQSSLVHHAKTLSVIQQRGRQFMRNLGVDLPKETLIRSDWTNERRMYKALMSAGRFSEAAIYRFRAMAVRFRLRWHRWFGELSL